MTIPLNAAAPRIANQLRSTEAHADAALATVSELLATIIQARANPEISVHAGQKAIIRLTKAQQALVEATTEVFRAHDEISQIGREMGLFDEPGLTKGSGLNDSHSLRAA